ncbi:uncharacterized protein PV06_06536 [Exophiala oligosperma]|nr:uncharacterized protein PV06_06536 [Exophiala oligosperma]KIW40931.1 hypothetical protein PV06_06536 [Exophiala oligosperma]
MDSTVKRDTGSEAVPSAKFLQARITALSTTLIKRLENIFAVALDETGSGSTFPPGGNDAPAPASLTETSIQQFQLDVESTAVIRAAEEIMMLTRTLKEIWLFGGLDTLEEDRHNERDEAMRKRMDEDIKVVEDGFRRFLEKYETAIEVDTNSTRKAVEA